MNIDPQRYTVVALPKGDLDVGDLVCTVTAECRADATVMLYPTVSDLYGGAAACAEHLPLVETETKE